MCSPRFPNPQGERDYDESDLAFLAKKKAEEAALKELKAKVRGPRTAPWRLEARRQSGPQSTLSVSSLALMR